MKVKNPIQDFLDDFTFLDCRLGDHPRIVTAIYQVDGDSLRCIAGTGSARQTRDLRLPLKGSISGYAVWSGKDISTPDLQGERIYQNAFFDRESLKSLLVLPLGNRNKPYGAVSLASNELNDFHEREQGRAQILTALLSYIVDYEQTRIRIRSPLTERLGATLRSIRGQLGLTQEELAALIGTSRIAVSRWEAGAQPPSWGPLRRWCEALGILSATHPTLVTTVDITPQLLRFLNEDPGRLSELSPAQFERFVAERLDRMGFNVNLTGDSTMRDGGIDLVAVPKAGSLGTYMLAGQVKHHRDDRKTGRPSVDRLLAWADTAFRIGLLVTNTGFTKDALWLAEKNPEFLRLRDFEDLKRWIQENFWSPEEWKEIPTQIELAPGISVAVPKPTTQFQSGHWHFDVPRKH